jgi:hypothetical protein
MRCDWFLTPARGVVGNYFPFPVALLFFLMLNGLNHFNLSPRNHIFDFVPPAPLTINPECLNRLAEHILALCPGKKIPVPTASTSCVSFSTIKRSPSESFMYLHDRLRQVKTKRPNSEAKMIPRGYCTRKAASPMQYAASVSCEAGASSGPCTFSLSHRNWPIAYINPSSTATIAKLPTVSSQITARRERKIKKGARRL